MDILILALYCTALLLMLSYNFSQLSLTIRYLIGGRKKAAQMLSAPPPEPAEWPRVTVQLPLYNERYVVERLIDAAAAMDYPKDRLQIQILDDSTDDTVERAAAKTAHYRSLGYCVEHVRRPDRVGYKAGALDWGLRTATGDFVAIFDADFLPHPDFLRKTIPHFLQDPRAGVVQTRWTHLNEDANLLTQLQAFGLNAHFFVEQGGRSSSDFFMNFNGTGGVWRRAAIEEAGGWSGDTLSEDLDLSYRAQLAGWRFLYREDIASPAELPVEMHALKSQQYRWMKGAAECARKLTGRVLRDPAPGFHKKAHAFFHLFASATFVLLFCIALLSVPLLIVRHRHPEWSGFFAAIDAFQINFIILMLFYGVPFVRAAGARPRKFAVCFPMYATLMLGLSLHNTIAVLEGYAGRKTPFVRTPKFGEAAAGSGWRGNAYLQRAGGWLTVAEVVLMLYFLFGIAAGIYLQDWSMMTLHAMLVAGYGMVVGYAVVHGARHKASSLQGEEWRPNRAGEAQTVSL